MMGFAVAEESEEVEDAAERSCLVSSTIIGVSSSSSSSSSSPSLLKNGGARCSGHNNISVLRTREFSRRTGTNPWGRGREFIIAVGRASCDRWNGKAQLYDVRFVQVQMQLGPSSLWYSIIVTAVVFFRRHPSK
jgi:hypothetical protein